MPHVTFIHGIANKPEPDELVRLWRAALAQGVDGLDLGAEGVTSRMVYWADVMYAEPQSRMAAHERNESVVTEAEPEPDLTWRDEIEGDEREWADGLASKIGVDRELSPRDEEEIPPVEGYHEERDAALERVPLPWWLKRRLMQMWLRDVHHYLFNAEHRPRPEGPTYRVQDEIRRRLIEALQEGAHRTRPHLLVSHSMGTVIAYDCLKRVPGCPRVDALITIGCPLGLDEIQDKMQPEWTREDGFPAERTEHWLNVYDRLDVVAAFDPNLANDYMRGGQQVVADLNEQNFGRWRHSISHYLGGPKLRGRLASLLEL